MTGLSSDRPAAGRRRRGGRPRPRPRPLVPALVAAAAVVAAPGTLSAQYAIGSPSGDSLRFALADVRRMLDSTRALRTDLEEDPRVLYRIGFGDPVPERTPDAAWPWNAVEPASDSVVDLRMPGNLREASRAYENYSVIRMRIIRGRDPDAPCDSLVAWESEAVSAFADGWIVARTLFGGPPYPPLDALPFAREAGHLPALVSERGSRYVGACAAEWAEAHPGAVEAWLAWVEREFPSVASGAPGESDGLEDLVRPEDPDRTGPADLEGA